MNLCLKKLDFVFIIPHAFAYSVLAVVELVDLDCTHRVLNTMENYYVALRNDTEWSKLPIALNFLAILALDVTRDLLYVIICCLVREVIDQSINCNFL